MAKRTILFRDLGTIEYAAAWKLQEDLLQKGVQEKARWQSAPADAREDAPQTTDHLFFCEHPHVYTLGKSGDMGNLLADDAKMAEINASFYKTNRGGDITYHGPGQVVGYPVLDLEHFFTDLGLYMRNLEEVMIRTLERYGIEAGRLPGSTGVWLDADVPAKARKICAMGVRCSRWITIHGFALNVNTQMEYFGNIVPCGIADKQVTSLEKELGRQVDMHEVKEILKEEFGKIFLAEIVTEAAEPVANV
ncbi:MAG: lipoyl(octanoyl) transferase LipB [Sphingobacteriales bacterium]|nr:MAG: lipoyl(octanoyl) transferase LipB [Sphingobacteriales bacterium]